MVSVAVFAELHDFEEVEKLRKALVAACEDTIAPGYSVVVRTESNDGVAMPQ